MYQDTSTKIFVGGLNYNTVDDMLMATFSRFGNVTDYVIMKFPESGESRGFGFVTFSSEREVQWALNSQPIVIDGKKVDLRRAEAPKNDGTKIGGGPRGAGKNRGDAKFKIFVGGLAYTTPDDMLKQVFSRYGKVQDWIIMKFPESKESRGFGFVTFTNQEEVDRCLENQPIEIDGKTVDIKKAEPPTPRGEPNLTSKTMRKVFVGSLSYTTTKQDLNDYFSEFGDIEDAEVMKFYDTGKSRGFGFVTFKDAESVDNVQANRPHNINGKDCETRRATPEGKPEDQKGTIKKIMVKGFTDDISDEDVEEYFGKFGKVTKVDQLRWKDSGKKRGYGFVEFNDHDAVDKIILWGSHVIKGNNMDVKKALTEEEMREVKKNEANSNYNSNYGYGGGMNSNYGYGGGMNANRGMGGGMGNMRNGGMAGGMGGNMGGGMGGNMGAGMGGNMGAGMGNNMGGNMGGGIGGTMSGICNGGNVCGGGYGQMCGHGQQKPLCVGGNECGGGYGTMCGHGGSGKGGWGQVNSGDAGSMGGGNKGGSGSMGSGGGMANNMGGGIKKSEANPSPPGEDSDNKGSGWSYSNYGYGAGGYDMARYAKQLQGGMKGSNSGGAGGPIRGSQGGNQGSTQTPYSRQGQGWQY